MIVETSYGIEAETGNGPQNPWKPSAKASCDSGANDPRRLDRML